MANTLQKSLDAALGNGVGTFDAPLHVAPFGENDDRANMLQYAERLPQAGATSKATYVGIASFHNLDMLATGSYRYGILLDINQSQTLFWKTVFRLLRENPTPQGFVSAFYKRLRGDDLRVPRFLTLPETGTNRNMPSIYFYDPVGVREEFSSLIRAATAYPFLEPKAYARLHQMALEGRLLTQTVDLMNDRPRIDRLARWMREHNMHPNTIYASNVLRDFLAPTFRFGGSGDVAKDQLFGAPISKLGGPLGIDFYNRLTGSDSAPNFLTNLRALARPETVIFHASVTTAPAIAQVGTRKGRVAASSEFVSAQQEAELRLRAVHLRMQQLGYLSGQGTNFDFAASPIPPESGNLSRTDAQDMMYDLIHEIKLTARLIDPNQRQILSQVIEDGWKQGLKAAGSPDRSAPPVISDMLANIRTIEFVVKEGNDVNITLARERLGDIIPYVVLPYRPIEGRRGSFDIFGKSIGGPQSSIILNPPAQTAPERPGVPSITNGHAATPAAGEPLPVPRTPPGGAGSAPKRALQFPRR